MYRTALILVIIVVAATAFVAPTNQAVAFTRGTAQPMAVEAEIVSNVISSANVIAANVGDFGGYAWPATGLLFLGAVILSLAPPLADE